VLGLSSWQHLLQDLRQLLNILHICCWALLEQVLLCSIHLNEGSLHEVFLAIRQAHGCC
jgi:hypothetical protein